MNKPMLKLLCVALLVSVGATPGFAAPAKSVLDRPATISAKASRSLLLEVVQAGARLVAVGDRGHIVYSDDEGKTWTQAKVPVSAMLTSVHFPTPRLGWAVGHHGVILHSADAGATWQLQQADRDETSEKAGAPLLGVWFVDASNGYAVGAYGYFLATKDGGRSWLDNSGAVPNPDGWHLNAIRGTTGGSVYLVGEHGKIFRSSDNGTTWRALTSPFDGSFFGVAPLGADLVLIYGLQGRLFASTDQGSSWRQVQTGVTSGLNAAARLANGKVVVAGNAGVILVAADSRLELVPELRNDRQSVMALVPMGGNALLTVGEGGAKSFSLGAK